jgi:hypothetical protein
MRSGQDFLLLKPNPMATLITAILLWLFFWANLVFSVFLLLVILPDRRDGGEEHFAQKYAIVILFLLSFLFSFMMALL